MTDTCQFCPNPTRGENCRTCWDCIGKVAREGSGKAHGWVSDDAKIRDTDAIAKHRERNKARSEARLMASRNERRNT